MQEVTIKDIFEHTPFTRQKVEQYWNFDQSGIVTDSDKAEFANNVRLISEGKIDLEAQ